MLAYMEPSKAPLSVQSVPRAVQGSKKITSREPRAVQGSTISGLCPKIFNKILMDF